jgi:hypothetical protein
MRCPKIFVKRSFLVQTGSGVNAGAGIAHVHVHAFAHVKRLHDANVDITK